MRLPDTAHASRPWRIHELTGDFRLEDVWALPTPGGPDDFPRVVHGLPRLVRGLDAAGAPAGFSRVARALWAIRWKLGPYSAGTARTPVWPGSDARDGCRPTFLRPVGPDLGRFASLYLLKVEWAAEIANRTMHGVLHLGWVPAQTGGYRAQMAVLVKPNGRFGAAYMAAIRPLRHLIVYPAMLRSIEREWPAAAQQPARRPT